MFIKQKPKSSKQRVITLILTPEEGLNVWRALVNTHYPSEDSNKMSRLLWQQGVGHCRYPGWND